MSAEALARFRNTADGALLGKDFLEKYRDKYPWEIGGTYNLQSLGGVSITFVGTFESKNSVYNTVILAGCRYLQEVDDSLGTVSQAYVKVDDPRYAPAVMAAIDQEVPEKHPYETTTVDQRSFLTNAVEDLAVIIEFSRIVLLITLCVVLAAVANTISMSTRDRIQEIGMLRSLGYWRRQILWLVLGESLLLCLTGGALGLLGTFCVLNLQRSEYGLRGVNMLVQVTPAVALAALFISLGVGCLGGILPAIGASRVNIVSSIRQVD